MLTPLHNRAEAGRRLGLKLQRYGNRGDVIVLGLPRGGVPVGFEVARALAAPLDVLIVRKLGAPGYHELAMGAIASGGARVINEDVVASLGIPHFAIERAVVLEEEEIARREKLYRGRRPPLDVRGKIVILVDDGMATGASMLVAVKALRSLSPARIVVASGVSSPSACSAVGEVADECVCVLEPDDLGAISPWYDEFDQTADEEVCALLARAGERPRGRPRHPHRTLEHRAS
ncbi:MAG TPA: phosphoribosyltransferase [Vicinamibacteria bacterium]|nr:phosphoribosyltransferase [Vicinamibacteria bacterium]HRB12605.1 phosphoribosyltransferase [Vicinamibacteria bacterium]